MDKPQEDQELQALKQTFIKEAEAFGLHPKNINQEEAKAMLKQLLLKQAAERSKEHAVTLADYSITAYPTAEQASLCFKKLMNASYQIDSEAGQMYIHKCFDSAKAAVADKVDSLIKNTVAI